MTDTSRDNHTDTSRFKLHIKPAFGKKDPRAIRTWDVKKFRAGLEKKGLSAQTVKHILGLLRRLIRFGVRHDFFADPGCRFDMPALDNEKVETLTPAEMRRLLDLLESWPDRQAASLVLLALRTGMRRSELLRLRWDDLSEDFVYVLIRHPKGGRSHTVPLSEAARTVLRELPRSGDTVFVDRDGKPRRCFTRAL